MSCAPGRCGVPQGDHLVLTLAGFSSPCSAYVADHMLKLISYVASGGAADSYILTDYMLCVNDSTYN